MRQAADFARELLRAIIGVRGVAEPCTSLQHVDPGSGKKAHLGRKLAGLLTPIVEILCKLGVEKDDSLADRHTVLCAPKAEHVDTRFPGNLCGAAAERGAGVRKACAVHMQLQPELAAGPSNRTNLFDLIQLARLCWLGDGDDARFGIVNVSALERDGADGLRRELAVWRRGDEELGAVGEKLRRTALVRLDVRRFGTDDAVIALAEGGEREGVGRCSIEDEEDFTIGFEESAKRVRCAGGPYVAAIGRLVAVVGFVHRRNGLRTHSRIIITGKLLRLLLHRYVG